MRQKSYLLRIQISFIIVELAVKSFLINGYALTSGKHTRLKRERENERSEN